MSYATSMSATRHIARAAQQEIKTKTGMRVTLVLCPSDNPRKTPEQLLWVVAQALKMSPENYYIKNRKREIVELRFVAALLLRRYFPAITLKQIALLFGGQDHTSVMNALTRAQNLLYTQDPAFTNQYDHAYNKVHQWIND